MATTDDEKTGPIPFRYGHRSTCSILEGEEDGFLVQYVLKIYNKPDHVPKHDVPQQVHILTRVMPRHKRIIDFRKHKHDSDGRLRMVFAYYKGEDLGQFVRPHEPEFVLPEAFLWHVFLQMADALVLLHDGYDRQRPGGVYPPWEPVVHGAVEPSNILCRQKYDPNGDKDHRKFPSLVLGDFGNAFLGQRDHGFRKIPEFPAPEYPEVYTSSDVWGLGATIHTLAHGEGPIVSMAEAERKKIGEITLYQGQQNALRACLKDNKRRTIKPLPARYSRQLQDCISRCLEEDSGQRISSRDLVEMILEQNAIWREYKTERDRQAKEQGLQEQTLLKEREQESQSNMGQNQKEQNQVAIQPKQGGKVVREKEDRKPEVPGQKAREREREKEHRAGQERLRREKLANKATELERQKQKKREKAVRKEKERDEQLQEQKAREQKRQEHIARKRDQEKEQEQVLESLKAEREGSLRQERQAGEARKPERHKHNERERDNRKPARREQEEEKAAEEEEEEEQDNHKHGTGSIRPSKNPHGKLELRRRKGQESPKEKKPHRGNRVIVQGRTDRSIGVERR